MVRGPKRQRAFLSPVELLLRPRPTVEGVPALDWSGVKATRPPSLREARQRVSSATSARWADAGESRNARVNTSA